LSDIKIDRVDIYIVKAGEHDRFGGQNVPVQTLGQSSYYFETEWREVYSVLSQSCFVKLTTNTGCVGWGEAQAPMVPEVAGTLLRELLAPLVLGLDPRRHEVIFDRLYRSMNVRGHTTGFMLDAIAGIDLALWDLRGRLYHAPVCELLGGPFRKRLPAYISGIRMPDVNSRVQAGREAILAGYSGVKAYLGRGAAHDAQEMLALRDGLPAGAEIETDLFWKYDRATAIRLGRTADEVQAAWLESPLDPEDVAGHAALAAAIDTPVAVGEPLRSARAFRQWLDAEALDIAQPDVLRTGITEGKKIADLANHYHREVAFHTSTFLGVGLAATFHLAAAVPNFRVQEHQPVSMAITNRFIDPVLEVDEGEIVVPMGDGFGVTVDEERLASAVAYQWTVAA
jgi:L-alanine-DL-glutamate epimerase-like enolase superfamily enzyme